MQDSLRYLWVLCFWARAAQGSSSQTLCVGPWPLQQHHRDHSSLHWPVEHSGNPHWVHLMMLQMSGTALQELTLWDQGSFQQRCCSCRAPPWDLWDLHCWVLPPCPKASQHPLLQWTTAGFRDSGGGIICIVWFYFPWGGVERYLQFSDKTQNNLMQTH